MSQVVTINAAAGAKVTFTNIFGTDEYAEKENIALDELALPLADDDVWNTGMATIGNPHIDEIALGQHMAPPFENAAIAKDRNGWKAKHIVSIRLFRTNSFIYLFPGDSIEITCETAEAAVYYFGIHDPLLSVTYDYVTEGAESHPEETAEPKPQLNRTTGIGDADDGDAETVYPFQFDTVAATDGELGEKLTLTADTDIAADEPLFGKVVGDLQSNVVVGKGKITGTLNYVTDYTGFSSKVEEQSGNYLALHFASDYAEEITVEVVNGFSGPTKLDEDGIIVLRIADKDTQSIKAVATAGDKSVTKEFSLSELVVRDNA